jgi:PadR family transcriptional regulator, regulatory protein PadR
MGTRHHFTYSSVLVLQAIAHGYVYGFDVMDVTGLPSGTVYPALRRLTKQGFIKGSWESDAIAEREQRPARRYYELTARGNEALAEALRRFPIIEGAIPSAKRKGRTRPARADG